MNIDTAGMVVALEARNLRVETTSGVPIVEDVSISLRAGEIYGFVGESGSGKTTAALAMLGFTQPGVQVTSGEVLVDGVLTPIDSTHPVSNDNPVGTYVPQNPGTALNPSMRIGTQIRDVAVANGVPGFSDDAILEALGSVGLPPERVFARRYPHQLSGGQQQRVSTAAAIAPQSRVVVLDEPTTGLDVITQARVLSVLRRLARERNVAMLYVTHDLGVVAQIADRIAVMYAGRIVEQGSAVAVLKTPRHPYTRGLLAAVPDHALDAEPIALPGGPVAIGERPDGCPFSPRCEHALNACEVERPAEVEISHMHTARCIHTDLLTDPQVTRRPRPPRRTNVQDDFVLSAEHVAAGYGPRGFRTSVASDVSFSLRRGGCLALVGESGSGKSTLARCVAGLHDLDEGVLRLHDDELPSPRARTKKQRREIQIVFQNPMDALNPRRSVGATLGRVVKFYGTQGPDGADAEVSALLEMVRLPKALARRYPRELSGGEAQRVGLARALAARPDVLICDEVTSALDVSSQAAVLHLLKKLQLELGLSLLFITHDIGVVAAIADEMAVLQKGRIVEIGSTETVLGSPKDQHTQDLLAAAPSVSAVLASRS